MLNNYGTTAPPLALILGPKFFPDYPAPKTEIDFAVKELVARILELKYLQVREDQSEMRSGKSKPKTLCLIRTILIAELPW